MTRRADVDNFLIQKKLALVGASRSGRKFGNTVMKELSSKGYEVFPIHPDAVTIDDVACYRSFTDLPQRVGGAILVVPAVETEKLVPQAAAAGIDQVWMQQGAASTAAVDLCAEHGITCVHGECILMFAEPAAWIHRCHRWIWGVLGKLPEQ